MLVIVFATFAVSITVIGDVNFGFLYLVVVSPIVALILLAGQETLRKRTVSIEQRLALTIRDSIDSLDRDVADFQSAIFLRAKTFEDRIVFYETSAVVELFAYARIKSFNIKAASLLARSQKKRTQLKDSLSFLSNGLENGDYYDAFRAVGDIILMIVELIGKKSNQCKLSSTDLYDRLRRIAYCVVQAGYGEARTLAGTSLQDIPGSLLTPDESRWAAIIMAWIDCRLHALALPGENKAERGIVFCSEYELLALDIVEVTGAFEAKGWRRVQEVISGSYRQNRIVPRVVVRGGIKAVSSSNYSYYT